MSFIVSKENKKHGCKRAQAGCPKETKYRIKKLLFSKEDKF